LDKYTLWGLYLSFFLKINQRFIYISSPLNNDILVGFKMTDDKNLDDVMGDGAGWNLALTQLGRDVEEEAASSTTTGLTSPYLMRRKAERDAALKPPRPVGRTKPREQRKLITYVVSFEPTLESKYDPVQTHNGALFDKYATEAKGIYDALRPMLERDPIGDRDIGAGELERDAFRMVRDSEGGIMQGDKFQFTYSASTSSTGALLKVSFDTQYPGVITIEADPAEICKELVEQVVGPIDFH